MTEDARELTDKWLKEMANQPLQLIKPTLIKVSEEFHFNGKSLWLGMERTSSPAEDLISQYVKAHEELVSGFKAISGQTMTDFNTGFSSSQPIPEINLEKDRVEVDIEKATTEDELWKIDTAKVSKYGLNEKFNQRVTELKGKS